MRSVRTRKRVLSRAAIMPALATMKRPRPEETPIASPPHMRGVMREGVRPGVRLDKWLWAARLFKTRALAAVAVAQGRVEMNGQPCKPARELKPGDRLRLRQGSGHGEEVRVLDVLALSAVRGPAAAAQALYAETAESIAARQRAADARRLAAEPAASIEQGRPTKRDRRRLADWQRWSASVDDIAGRGR